MPPPPPPGPRTHAAGVEHGQGQQEQRGQHGQQRSPRLEQALQQTHPGPRGTPAPRARLAGRTNAFALPEVLGPERLLTPPWASKSPVSSWGRMGAGSGGSHSPARTKAGLLAPGLVGLVSMVSCPAKRTREGAVPQGMLGLLFAWLGME